MKQLKFCFINVITGTGFKLDFKQEAKKKNIPSYKRFKKSKIHVTGKNCIPSEVYQSLFGKSSQPIISKQEH